MSRKLFALGNILMKDDGIAIYIAKELEKDLKDMEVIYGETDIGYCLTKICREDKIFILDASNLGLETGSVTEMSLKEDTFLKKGYTQHSYSFIDLLQLYYPNMDAIIYAVEISEVGFGQELSPQLESLIPSLKKELMERISRS